MLHQSIRILCLVVTHPGQHENQAKAAHRTWTQRCTHTIFITNAEPVMSHENYVNHVCEIIAAAPAVGETLQQFETEHCGMNGTNPAMAIPYMGSYEEWNRWFNPSFQTLWVPQADLGRDGLWNKTKVILKCFIHI